MANNSPTLVMASLSDDQLKKSIDSLVTHVDEAMKKMVQSTNNAVGEMEAKLKSLGNLKIDTGGSNDGGTGRRTQQHEKLTKAVNDASEAVSKETQKLQDLQQSLSGASDREQNFISQKERAANTIAQENELLSKQQSELAALKAQQQAVSDAHQKDMQARQQNAAAIEKQREAVANLKNEVKYWQSIVSQLQSGDKKTRFNSLWIGDTTSKQGHDILDVANKLYSIMQKLGMETEKGSASTGQAVKVVEQLAKYYKISREEAEKLVMSVQESPLARGKFTTHYDTRFGLDNLTMQKKDAEDSALRLLIAQSKLERQTDDLAIANKRLSESESASGNSSQKSNQIRQESLNLDAKIQEKEKEISETRGRIATAIREQTDAEAGANKAAKEKANIQSQVESQEKKVAEAKRQLATATQQQTEVEKQSVQNIVQQTAARDKQIKKNQEVATSFDQMAKAQQVAIRSANPSGIRNADTLQTMNIQLDLLRERLREARQQYSSFIALAAHATTTGDKGLFQFATDGVHRYEQEVRNLIPQIRTLQSGIQQMGDVIAPQGHTIQNYVNSLQKANPELAMLNAQYKSGTSLLQDQSTSYASATQSAQRYTEEIRKQAAEIRKMPEWKQGKDITVPTPSGYDAVVNSQKKLSLEEQLLQVYKQQEGQESQLSQLENSQNASANERLRTEQAITQEQEKRKKYASPTINDDAYQITRNAIARKLGIDAGNVVNADAQYDSIKRVGDALKQLQDAYTRMTNEERNSPIGKQMIRQMQELQRQSQLLRSQMSRPISLKDALSGSEKTLDDIAYKMRQLASYRSGLNVETQVKEIEQVNKKYAQLQKNMNDIMQKNTDMIASNTALGRSWNYMKNRLAFYFTIGASTTFVKNLIDIRSQYELLERSIGILFDSMQTGSKIFSELNQMAIKSPFTTMELGSAAKQLSAYNIAAKDVVDTTRRLADMAAAVGIPIERLTYALGQIKSYGYLNSRDARMFANAGIPLIQNLADMYTKLEGRLVSIGDVYDRIKKKQVSFEDTLKVVHEMTDEGGRFFNFQEKAADTLKVRLANLTLAWNNMLNNMGKSNQGVLTSGLGVLKEMFENWRKIENLVLAIATNLGTVKAIQLLILLNAKGITKQMALQEVLGKKLGSMIYGIARNLKMLAVNPMTWLTIAITAVTYLSWKFWDLTTANENFNKSIADGTKENIASIDKFFDKYRKDIESVGSMNTTDQEKMWERIREEIEKTTKNAQQYIDILEKIPELDKRVSKASGFLEQEKVIQEELNRLAQHGYFNIGGGFADDSYAETLTAIDKYTGEMIRKYGTYEDYVKAFKKEFQGFYDEFKETNYLSNLYEEVDESAKHFKNLENLNWGRILSGGTDEEKLARIRDTFMSLRDNFFATEEMQNAGAEAQALYNRHMDYWITSVAKANGLIKELTVNGKTYSAEDVAAVEERRTEWELFFSYLSDEDRRTMDYLVKTNQTGGEEFKNLWDTMTDSMKKSNAIAYRDLQKKIAELRKTPDIVINVVYREMRDKLDEQQQAFEDRWIRPKNWSARNLSAEEYLEEETANRTKYGRLMRKTEEDNVEWEDRLGKEYQENEKKIKSLNAQLQNKNKLSKADREQKEKDLNLYKDLNKAIEDIGKTENFNYDQFKKGGKKKDPLLDALKQEISLVEKLQNDYDKLSKSGASQSDALDTIRGAYGKTIRLLNAQLGGYGLPQIDISQLITGKDPNKALAHFKQTLDTLVRKGMLTLERSKELEAVVEKFTLSAKTYNLDMITKGLNNELGKLKDEYELAVELDANPELGNIFADMFDINVQDLPHSIEEYASRVVDKLNKAIKERGDNVVLPTLFLTEDDIKAYREMSKEGKLNKESLKEIEDAYNKIGDLREKAAVDVSKNASEYIKTYGDLSAQIALIEQEKNTNLTKLNDVYNTEALRQTQRYADAKLAIEEGARRKQAKATFEALKKETDYERFFTAIDTLTKADAISIKNKIKQGIIQAFKDGGLTVSEFRKEIKALESQFDKLTESSSLWTNYLSGGFDKLIQKAKETGREIEAIGESISIKGTIDDKDKNFLQSMGSIFSNGNGGNMDFTSLMNKFGKNMKGLGDAVSQAGKGMQQGAVGFAGAVGIVDTIIKNVHQTVQAIGSVIDELDSVRNEENKISNAYWEGFKKFDNYAMSGWENLKSGNVAGAIADTANSIISIFNTFSNAKTEKINKEIKESERSVKRLELAYIDLEHAINKAYGVAAVGAKKTAIENKKLQLTELNRQLQLEESRSKKRRDEDKIIDLQKQIKELRYDINESVDAIANDLLGISSVGDAATSIVKSMIDAFKRGEDYMKVFGDSFEDMIENLIINAIAGRVIGELIDEIWNDVDSWINEKKVDTNNTDNRGRNNGGRNRSTNGVTYGRSGRGGGEGRTYDNGGDEDLITPERIKYLREKVENGEEKAKAVFDLMMELFGIRYGQDSNSQLSKLQQGISQITEDTAGAIEALMNGVSQQVYLHSNLLTQIRDTVAGFDMDVQTATQAQMLLQLQQSYTVQMSIESILQGVLNPSGQGFRVELLS